MDIIEQVRAKYSDATVRELIAVAATADIPSGTFIKIARGLTPNPQYKTVKKLRVLVEEEAA